MKKRNIKWQDVKTTELAQIYGNYYF